jgi:hypothetical protein
MKQKLILFTGWLTIVLICTNVCADNGQTNQHNGIQLNNIIKPQNMTPPTALVCLGTVISVCGQNMVVPSATTNASIELIIPSPYVHKHFFAYCSSFGNNIPTASFVYNLQTCELPTCGAGSVTVCQHDLAIPAGVTVGSSKLIQIPQTMLAKNTTYGPQSFDVQCIEDPHDKSSYQISDDSSVSCNAFPCPAAELRVCDMPIDIDGGKAIGDVLNFQVPAPFKPDPFKVECLGTLGQPPSYQLVDSSNVHCTKGQ